jgi:hypothetical protein
LLQSVVNVAVQLDDQQHADDHAVGDRHIQPGRLIMAEEVILRDDGKLVRLSSDPPTVDIKSRQPDPKDSGPIVLNPPPAGFGVG